GVRLIRAIETTDVAWHLKCVCLQLPVSTQTRPWRFPSRLAGVLCKPPFAEFVKKSRIRCKRSLQDFYQRREQRCSRPALTLSLAISKGFAAVANSTSSNATSRFLHLPCCRVIATACSRSPSVTARPLLR